MQHSRLRLQLEFDPPLQVDTVAACFGTDCYPAALSGSGGEWSVPQSQEYLQSVSPGSITHVIVQATSEGDVVVEQVLEVAREQERGFGWPECPGPYRYLPVPVVDR